jgi:ribonuclease P/MRP protein subunit POP5
LPTLKERKRYLAFEIISDVPVNDPKAVSKAIWEKVLQFMGEFSAAKAGVWILAERFKNQRGLIRVNYKYVDMLKASLMLVDNIENHRVIVCSRGVSGTIKKAEGFIAG